MDLAYSELNVLLTLMGTSLSAVDDQGVSITTYLHLHNVPAKKSITREKMYAIKSPTSS